MKYEDLFKKEEQIESIEEVGKEFEPNEKASVIRQRNREKLLNDVITLWRQGLDKHEIEAQLNLTYAQVVYAIKVVEERLRNRTDQEYLAKRQDAVEELHMIKKELWQAWHKSKRLDKKVTIRRAQINTVPNSPNQGQPIGAQELEEHIEEMPGNIDYIKAIMWCNQERNKLEGLYAPKKIANTDAEGNNVPAISDRESILNMLADMKYNITTYEDRKLLEESNVVDGEIVREVEKEINNISPAKPTKLIEQFAEHEENE